MRASGLDTAGRTLAALLPVSTGLAARQAEVQVMEVEEKVDLGVAWGVWVGWAET